MLPIALAAHAAPLAADDVPGPLQPWVAWALAGHETETCPFLAGDLTARTCVWPGALTLSLDERGGRLSQEALAHVAGWLALPGDAKRWPLAVEVDGRAAAVLARDERPAVWLEVGEHTITGEFRWDTLPEILAVPPQTGLIDLAIGGARVAAPSRDEEGRLWVQRAGDGPAGETRLDVVVHRRVEDAIPLQLTTHIALKISGQNREIALAKPLPEGFAPMSLDSPLPARLDPDGHLRVQVRPGSFDLELTARHDGPVETLALAAPDGPWDSEEAWVFAWHPELREATVEGVPAVDASQTQLPDAWRDLPAYLVKPGDTVTLAQHRRGDETPAADRLSLQRTWWLDFDGDGYTVQDRITGTFHESWRLVMDPEVKLGRVAIASIAPPGDPSPRAAPAEQFINAMSPPGVEIRIGEGTIDADSRVEGRRTDLLAVGWRHDFEAVRARLNLPPGWRLLHATGVDAASPTWWSRWNLLDDFLVLVISLSVGRLWGTRWGLGALAALLLSWHEPDAPRWTWLVLVAVEALARVLPAGRLARLVGLGRAAVRVVLALVVLAFAIFEVRQALYPQLEERHGGGGLGQVFATADKAPMGGGQALDASDSRAYDAIGYAGERSVSVVQQRVSKLENMYAPDLRAQMTTGPGLPTWDWRAVDLTWSGPVDAEQRMHLWLSPPWMTFVLELAAVVLTSLLALRMLGVSPRAPRGAAAVLAFMAVGIPSAKAEEPAQPVVPGALEELRTRLLAAPDCAPRCAELGRVALVATPGGLRALVEASAQADTAVPLPGGTGQWTPSRVWLDGARASGLLRTTDGNLWIPLAPGAHQILLEGDLPGRDAVQLPLPLKPHRVEASLQGWTLAGVHDDGLPEDTLLLQRASTAGQEEEPTALPPFLMVTREVALGLSWEVTTRVTRLTPAGVAVRMEVPMLPGESVTTADLPVVDGRVQVAMGPNSTSAEWVSVLSPSEAIELAAPTGVPWVETWVVDASPMWHLEPVGIPPIHDASPGQRVRTWRPWPGESVRIPVVRPEGVPGQTTTVDNASLSVRPGLRSTDATLAFGYRSNRGTEQAITLPEGAEVQSFSVDGAEQPARQAGRTVTVPISPGSHQLSLTWRQPGGASLWWRTPAVNLGFGSVNDTLVVELPTDRWALALTGPRMGPAVLFWSLLAVFGVVSLLLGRLGWTPLRTRHWFGLLLGMSQVPLPIAGVVVAWLVALGWRRVRPRAGNAAFNLVQLGLPALTLVALGCLAGSIAAGLLGSPDMQVVGNDSGATNLRWYQDRSDGALPQATIVSAPLLVYRLAMLGWALWIASALLGWLRWAWEAWSDGGMWRGRPAATSPATQS
jgi:hypothetical protein